jgi:ATP-binding cassette subfamily B protein
MTLVEFKNVSFGYTPEAKKVLNQVSFKLQRGKSYAFVGPTGQGKSTTASLIAGLYEPSEGQILFKDKEIKDWPKNEFYNEIGFILQEPFLFSQTLLENLIYGNDRFEEFRNILQKSKDQQKEAFDKFFNILESKKFADLIKVFPDGLETIISDNSENISLGQKQIINFLRAVLREPSFLILDEATANLDTITEQSLQLILESLPAQTTKMIIAHRLNTIKNVDQVFLVGGGKIVPE